jgi:hypothetical protein
MNQDCSAVSILEYIRDATRENVTFAAVPPGRGEKISKAWVVAAAFGFNRDILGWNLDPEAVRRAFKKLDVKLHPDKNEASRQQESEGWYRLLSEVKTEWRRFTQVSPRFQRNVAFDTTVSVFLVSLGEEDDECPVTSRSRRGSFSQIAFNQ